MIAYEYDLCGYLGYKKSLFVSCNTLFSIENHQQSHKIANSGSKVRWVLSLVNTRQPCCRDTAPLTGPAMGGAGDSREPFSWSIPNCPEPSLGFVSMTDAPPPPPCGQIDSCENLTFPSTAHGEAARKNYGRTRWSCLSASPITSRNPVIYTETLKSHTCNKKAHLS